jgi:hypothetical protein
MELSHWNKWQKNTKPYSQKSYGLTRYDFLQAFEKMPMLRRFQAISFLCLGNATWNVVALELQRHTQEGEKMLRVINEKGFYRLMK